MLLCVLCGEFRHTLFLDLSKGEVPSILTDLPDVIEKILKNEESVSIRGLESFHTSITSNGFEHPEDVLPHEVRVSKVYFIADRKFTHRVSQMAFYRYPLSKYFPGHLLRAGTAEEEESQEQEDNSGINGKG